MNLDRIATLVSSGLKPSQVATIVGCSTGRISQILATEECQLLIAEKTALLEKEDIEEASMTAKYTAAEHALITQMMDLVPSADLRDVTAALRVVGDRQEKMRSRLQAPALIPTIQQTVISISLPSHAIASPKIERTLQNEITSIGDNTIAPLNSTAVTNLFSALDQKNQKKKELIEEGEDHVQTASISSSKASPVEATEEGFLSYAAR